LEAARFARPRIVFLGLHEPEGMTSALPSSEFSAKSEAPEIVARKVQGTAYFTLDISDVASEEEVEGLLERGRVTNSGLPLNFEDARVALVNLDLFDAGILASARSMVDWNERYKVRNPLRVRPLWLQGDRSTRLMTVLSVVWIPGVLLVGRLEVVLFFVGAVG
jgi:NADH pyrophosphatase-like rudimentary NUDIX domain